MHNLLDVEKLESATEYYQKFNNDTYKEFANYIALESWDTHFYTRSDINVREKVWKIFEYETPTEFALICQRTYSALMCYLNSCYNQGYFLIALQKLSKGFLLGAS